MPELPEVETIRRDLDKILRDKTIQRIEIRDRAILTGLSPKGALRRDVSAAQFSAKISGKKIAAFERRGKYLIMILEDQSSLLLHLRMTGQLLMQKPQGDERAAFWFDDGSSLIFLDRRRFGEILYSNDWKNEPSIRTLGIEPLNGKLTAGFLKESFSSRTGAVHSLLLNQKIVSGLGNIYAAEALYQSGIKPSKKAHRIPLPKLEELAFAIKKVLADSIENRGYSMNTYVDAFGKKGRTQQFSAVYGKENTPCKSCGAILQKMRLSGRGVVYCPRCQN